MRRMIQLTLLAATLLGLGLGLHLLTAPEVVAGAECQSVCHSRCMGKVNYAQCLQMCMTHECK